ncbi:MAG: hypothetical protein AAF570_23315, partial [Bacteroidota bacterium]
VTNDFIALLMEFLFGLDGFKLPITWSPGGWEFKFWMIDHPPAFAIYQILFMGTGFVLLLSGLFDIVRNVRVQQALVAGMLLSALLVLVAPNLHDLMKQTPPAFMIAQLLAGIALVPALLGSSQRAMVTRIAIYVAAVICLTIVVICALKSTITLRYVLLPLAGVVYLLVSKQQK